MSRVPRGTRAHSPMCALSEMINLCSQPFKPTNKSQHTHVYGWNPQRALRADRATLSSPLPLLSFFAASSKRPGRWITTPLPERKNSSGQIETKSTTNQLHQQKTQNIQMLPGSASLSSVQSECLKTQFLHGTAQNTVLPASSRT